MVDGGRNRDAVLCAQLQEPKILKVIGNPRNELPSEIHQLESLTWLDIVDDR